MNPESRTMINLPALRPTTHEMLAPLSEPFHLTLTSTVEAEQYCLKPVT
jgi:hypothetical protein